MTLNRIEYSDVVAVMNSRLRCGPPKVRFGRALGQVDLADERAVGIEAMNAIADPGPHSPGVVEADAVEVSGGVLGEQPAPCRACRAC